MSQFLRSALAVVCPACDAYNPARTEKCSACGQAIEGGPRAPAASGTPQAQAKSASRPVLAPEPVRPPRPGEAVPPGMRPSARTPAPVPGVAPAPVAPAAPPRLATPPSIPKMTAQPLPLTQPAQPPPSRRTTTGEAIPAARPAAGASRFAIVVQSRTGQLTRYRLPNGPTLIGRNRGGLIFPDDPFVSAQHAALMIKEGALTIRDEASPSGVYLAIRGQEVIHPGALFCAGNRLFRYTGPLHPAPALPNQMIAYGAPVPSGQALYGVEEILIGGRAGRAITTVGPLVTVGSQACDLTYPNDPGLAPRHLELSPTPMQATLRDLSGGFGTFVRLPAQQERPLVPGDRFRIGQQLFQIEAA